MLNEIFNSHFTDKGDMYGVKHAYAGFYEKYLHNKRETTELILEIGVCGGRSLKAWYDYFPKANIIALDINDKSQFNNDRTFTFILDQSSEEQLAHFADECKREGYEFDSILDDGSHHMIDQQITFGYLFPFLKPGGVYFIEDLHTSLADNGTSLYWRNLDIQENRKNTTLFWLMESFDSIYLSPDQNEYNKQHIHSIEIHNYFNPNQDPTYKLRSITSAIVKK